jgi:hypothetical protein
MQVVPESIQMMTCQYCRSVTLPQHPSLRSLHWRFISSNGWTRPGSREVGQPAVGLQGGQRGSAHQIGMGARHHCQDWGGKVLCTSDWDNWSCSDVDWLWLLEVSWSCWFLLSADDCAAIQSPKQTHTTNHWAKIQTYKLPWLINKSF